MDKDLKIYFLFDFYGQMLTKKQYEIIDFYYNNDYSLAEISKLLDVSRQAVYDNKKRALEILNTYESKLKLVTKFENITKITNESLELLNRINLKNLCNYEKKIIEKVQINLSEIDKVV